MGILNDLRTRVATVNNELTGGGMIRDVLVGHRSDILDLQKRQLFEGKASNGEDIRPYYSEDLKPGGYFHSRESAGRYAAWKMNGITYPYSANRNADAPNLYINGRFHKELDVVFLPESVAVQGMTSYAQQIVAKYGLNTFGLMPVNWSEIFANRGALAELMQQIKAKLYV